MNFTTYLESIIRNPSPLSNRTQFRQGVRKTGDDWKLSNVVGGNPAKIIRSIEI